MRQDYAHNTAQAASEYALALALVALVGIGGLAVFGPSLLQALGLMGTSVAGTGTIASKAPTAGPLPASTTTGTSTLAITLSDGSTIAVPNYPTSQAQLVDTMGTNGATDLYIAALRDLADQLVLSGELTPEQAGYLTNLANAGHELAQEEKLLEDYCFGTKTAGGSTFSLDGATETYQVGSCNIAGASNSQLSPDLMSAIKNRITTTSGGDPDIYILSDLAPRYNTIDALLVGHFYSNYGTVNTAGIDAANLVLADPSATTLEKLQAVQENVYPGGISYSATNGGYPTPPVFDVYNQYQRAQDNGSLDNPAVKAVVGSLVNEILNMQTRLGDAILLMTQTNPDLTTAKQTKVSGPTHGKSSDICTAGAGSDTGVQCSE